MTDDIPVPFGAGVHRPDDGRLILPERREYEHFAITPNRLMVFDWSTPTEANKAYDVVLNSDQRIVAWVKRHFGLEFFPLVKALGEHLSRSRYVLVSQIQIHPGNQTIEVFGEVAVGEVVRPGEIRESDVRRAEQLARARAAQPGRFFSFDEHDEGINPGYASGAASVKRPPKGTHHIK